MWGDVGFVRNPKQYPRSSIKLNNEEETRGQIPAACFFGFIMNAKRTPWFWLHIKQTAYIY